MLMKPLLRPLKNPNLPENDVTSVLISSRAGEAIKSLKANGIQCFKTEENRFLSPLISSHADMNYCNYSEGVLYKFFDNTAGEWSRDFNIFSLTPPKNNSYPYDVTLNCVRIGNKIICNKKTVAREILDIAYKDELVVIDSKQGYSKCSVCVLNENAIITDDVSIYNAAAPYFVSVTLISKGSVLLPGYDYGFIGGCTGLIGKNKLAFNGRIMSHSDHNKIIDALIVNSMTAIELTVDRLEDIGSILPLTEKI